MRGTKPRLVVSNDAVTRTPPAPSWLSKDGKAEWRRVLPILVKRRILTTADLASLENYCSSIGEAREMEAMLQKEGRVVSLFKENDGEMVCVGLKKHPACSILSDAMTRARLLAAELGLTPVSRSRPAIREDGDDDQFDPLNIG